MNRNSTHSGKQLVSGIAMIVGSSVVAFGIYVLGMIFLSFAGGTHGGQNIPRSFELIMLLLWPVALGITAILPGVVLLASGSWQWPLRLAIGGGVICMLWWFLGMGLMMSYGSRPVSPTPANKPLPPPMKATVEHANRFTVTAAECEERGLPSVDFALSWPDHVQRDSNAANSDRYIVLQRFDDESGAIREELEIRPAAGIRAPHDSSSGLPHPENVFFDQLVDQARADLGADYDVEVFHASWDRLETGRRIQAQRKATADPSRPKAILQFVLSPPSPSEHGLHVTMRAFEASHVDNCVGFENVGMPQQVLASFHWMSNSSQ